jgi:RNA polymerase sigma factor (sigma-70 family)
MEVSALKYSGRGGLYARSPLLRLQSDERLVAVIRRGNTAAFELLVSRYETRLLSFCRHLLRSREDAEDVLQEVLTAAYNAMLSDDRPINVRPWLYRIARNRCLNHLRKAQAIGVDSMDVHFSDNGASTADKAHDREEFRQLVGDIHGLPETQRTALVLREMDALSYEQIAEAMDTTVPSVKSLLVRARVSLAEASEARLLTCEEVREELGEAAEGLIKKPGPAVRRHLKSCSRCERFGKEIRHSRKAVAAALVPISAVGLLRKLLLVHLLGHSAGSGAASAAGASATGTGAVAGAGAAGATAGVAGGAGSGGLISAGVGAVATKAAAGLAAAALVTAGTVAVSHEARHHAHQPTGLQVLTTSVNAGVARSDAIAPRLAAPVQALPAAKPTKTREHATRTVKPARTMHNRLAAAQTARPTPTTAATAVTSTTPTATAASVGTPTLGTPTTPTLGTPTTPTLGTPTTPTLGTATTPTATTSATTPTTNTTATTATTTSTTATTTTTTPTETATTPTATTPTTTTPSAPPTGGNGIIPSSPVTTVVSALTSTPGS